MFARWLLGRIVWAVGPTLTRYRVPGTLSCYRGMVGHTVGRATRTDKPSLSRNEEKKKQRRIGVTAVPTHMSRLPCFHRSGSSLRSFDGQPWLAWTKITPQRRCQTFKVNRRLGRHLDCMHSHVVNERLDSYMNMTASCKIIFAFPAFVEPPAIPCDSNH